MISKEVSKYSFNQSLMKLLVRKHADQYTKVVFEMNICLLHKTSNFGRIVPTASYLVWDL